MADIDKAKRNIAKMVSMNAPEADIDAYISSEGLTLDQIRNHKIGSQPAQSVQAKPDRTFTEGLLQNVKNPFMQTIGQTPMGKGAAYLLDKPMEMVGNLFDASGKVGTSLAEGNTMGAVEGGTRAATSLLSAPFLPAMTWFNAGLGLLPESAQKIASAPFSPAKTFMGEGDIPATIDNVFQGGLAGIGLKKGLQSPQKFADKRMAIAEKNVLRSAPPTGEVNFNIKDDFKKFSPYLKEEASKGFKGKDITRQADAKVERSLNKFYNSYIEPQLARTIQADAELNLTSAIDKMKQTVGESDNIFDKAKAKSVNDLIENIPANMKFEQANALLKDLNSKTKSYENATGSEQYSMLQKDPKLEAMIAFKRGLRDTFVEKLGEYGEKDTQKLRDTYGSGARVRDLVHKNVLPAENQAREPIFGFDERAGLYGFVQNVISRAAGLTKEGNMKKGFKRVGRYADRPAPPQVPNPEILGILNRNRFGEE